MKADLTGNIEIVNYGWPDKFIEHGSRSDLFAIYRLDGKGLKHIADLHFMQDTIIYILLYVAAAEAEKQDFLQNPMPCSVIHLLWFLIRKEKFCVISAGFLR